MAFTIYTRAPGASTYASFHANSTLNAAFDSKVGEARARCCSGEFAEAVIVNDTATSTEARYVWIVKDRVL